MHHGTTAVLWEPDTQTGSSYVYFRLERCCSIVSWQRPAWRRIKSQMEFNVAINPEENIVPRIVSKPVYNSTDIDGIFHTLDEGILDLATVKDISMGSRNQGMSISKLIIYILMDFFSQRLQSGYFSCRKTIWINAC